MRTMRIEVRPAFAMGLGLLIALDPGGLWLPFLIAAAVHELGHILCLRLCRVKIMALRIGFAGAELQTAPMDRLREGLCAAAGPLVNLLSGFLLLRHFFPFAALSLLLAGFNLLPVWPLDGGRILTALWPKAAGVISAVSMLVLLAGGMVMTAVLHQGLWPLLLLSVLLVKIAVQRLQEQKLIANPVSPVYNK